MNAEVGVVLIGGESLATPLAERTGVPVVASTVDDHLEVAARLNTEVELVVGLARDPWPTAPDLHAQGSAELPAYTGVVSWHALPALHDALAQAAAPGTAMGAHLLVTAPDPGPETDPADLMFLREVAEAVASRVDVRSRSIAWRGDDRRPTAVEALRSVVEAHGHRDIVEVPVGPTTGADAALLATADELGARLTTVDLGRATLLDLLTTVVLTVIGHEDAAEDAEDGGDEDRLADEDA